MIDDSNRAYFRASELNIGIANREEGKNEAKRNEASD
jgi:hypothetical protein